MIIKNRFSLSHSCHTEFLYIGLIELLSLLQQVINIHTQSLRYRFSIRIISKARLPEHKEVLALLHSPPRPSGIAAEHVVRSLFKSFIPGTRSDIHTIITNSRNIHHLYGIRISLLMDCYRNTLLTTFDSNLCLTISFIIVFTKEQRHLNISCTTLRHSYF